MKSLIFIAISVVSFSMLSACSGTLGTLAWRDWEDNGTRVTEIRSAGLEVRNLPGNKGALIGWRHTIYGSRLVDPAPSNANDTPWRYGWAPGPPAMPVHLSETTYGLESGWEPSFRGASLGISSRSISILPVDGDEVLEVLIDARNPEKTKLKMQQYHR